MYYNAIVGGAWCSGSTRDSDPLSVSSILIAPATKNTFAFADVFFYEAHLWHRKMKPPLAMKCVKFCLHFHNMTNPKKCQVLFTYFRIFF